MKKLSLLVVSFLLLVSQSTNVFAEHHASNRSIDKGITNAKNELSDAGITAKVKAQLLADSATSGMSIKVTTVSGVVTLTGKVKSEAEKKLAEDIAAQTQGVKGVNNKLEVE